MPTGVLLVAVMSYFGYEFRSISLYPFPFSFLIFLTLVSFQPQKTAGFEMPRFCRNDSFFLWVRFNLDSDEALLALDPVALLVILLGSCLIFESL